MGCHAPVCGASKTRCVREGLALGMAIPAAAFQVAQGTLVRFPFCCVLVVPGPESVVKTRLPIPTVHGMTDDAVLSQIPAVVTLKAPRHRRELHFRVRCRADRTQGGFLRVGLRRRRAEMAGLA